MGVPKGLKWCIHIYVHAWSLGTTVKLIKESLGSVESTFCVRACLLHLTRALTVLTSLLFNLKLPQVVLYFP